MNTKSVAGLLIALVALLGLAGTVLAYDPTPPADDLCPFEGACGGYGMHGLGFASTTYDILAEELGMSAEALYEALSEGQTVAEIAAARGIEVGDLVTTLIAPRVESLQAAVADGNLTAEQAEYMIEEMTEHMTWRLENLGLGNSGGFGRGGCSMGGGQFFDRSESGGYFGRSGGMHGGMRGGRWNSDWSSPRSPAWSTLSSS
jgi:hypothetical protein